MNSELLSISQKLQQAARYSVQERRRERAEAEEQISAIQEALQERKNREEAEIESTKEKIAQLGQYLDDTVRSMSAQSSREAQKITTLREELQQQIQTAQKDHQQRLEGIITLSEEKLTLVNDQLQKKTRAQKEKIELYLTTLSKKLLTIQKQFKDQSQSRKNGQGRLKSHFYDELDQFKEVIQRERQRRVSSQRKIQAMVEEIQEKLTQEVAGLTAKRRRNNEAVLKLVELACQKMQEKAQE